MFRAARFARARGRILALWLAGSGTLGLGALPAQAQLDDPSDRQLIDRFVDGRLAVATAKAQALGTISPVALDTVWIGRGSVPTFDNPWAIHVGPNRPGQSPDGFWSWEPSYFSEGDSLQGWWPIRRRYTITGGLTLPDADRSWWGIDVGNQVNYVLNSNRGTGRTFGVNGVWHVDGGSLVPSFVLGGDLTWLPLSGQASAWCGLRADGDVSTVDAASHGGYGNAFNARLLQFNGESSKSRPGTNKRFPGYGSQWDQMLYRDVAVQPGSELTVSFQFATRMSTGADLTPTTRCGWFDMDPTSVSSPNFISSTNAGPGAPVDSFMLYVGVPANPTSCVRADGTIAPIQDLKRRWFSEVLAIDRVRFELLSVAGDHAPTQASFTLTPSQIGTLLAGGGSVLRIVFRSKTNRGFDDQDGGLTGYSSQTEGAVRIDEVTVSGSGVSAVYSGFENASEINNSIEPPQPSLGLSEGYAIGSWHATGKPPAIYFHPHRLDDLVYQDPCGSPDNPSRHCNLGGTVISAGDHDRDEAVGGPVGTSEGAVMDGMISPTINLMTSGPPNSMGVTPEMLDASDDYYIRYDVYTGALNLFQTGNAWTVGLQSYPDQQSNGVECWGEIRVAPFQMYSAESKCFFDVVGGFANDLIRTSNASGVPDSIRIFIGKSQQCFRFGVVTECSPSSGAYFDNVSLGFASAGDAARIGSTALRRAISVDRQQWWVDAFPFNRAPLQPGTAEFDTTTALLKSSINIAQSTGDEYRAFVLGDTIVVLAPGENVRTDLIFRISPGPGNYVVIGDRNSGLRRVPTDPTPATPGDGSFWGEYLASHDGGSGFGSSGGHTGGVWNPQVWNAARCDTVEINYVPVMSRGNLPSLAPGAWATMYHEGDPKFALLGSPKHRCFLIDTLGAVGGTNTTCSQEPIWATTLPSSRTGYDGSPITLEYTKIIPDGVLTPGTRVQYFFRKSEIGSSDALAFAPDTGVIFPQKCEGISLEPFRYQAMSVLPNEWQRSGGTSTQEFNPTYRLEYKLPLGGKDGRSNLEFSLYQAKAAQGEFELLGVRGPWELGAGFKVTAVDLTDFKLRPFARFGISAAVKMPDFANFDTYTTVDIGNVPIGEVPLVSASGQVNTQVSATVETMASYALVGFLVASLAHEFIGPARDYTPNGRKLFSDWIQTRQALHDISGFFRLGPWPAFQEPMPPQEDFYKRFFDSQWRGRYRDFNWWDLRYPDLRFNQYVPGPRGEVQGVENDCSGEPLGVLEAAGQEPGTVAAAHYQDGPDGPYIASLYSPATQERPFISLMNGFSINSLYTRFGDSQNNLPDYFYRVYSEVFGSLGPIVGPTPPVGVGDTIEPPPHGSLAVANNPLGRRPLSFRLGLRQREDVNIAVYDIAGRVVHRIAAGPRDPGEHTIEWSGRGKDGKPLHNGVYFARVAFGRHLATTRSIVILR